MIAFDDGNSNKSPLVCICIPTYNASGTVLETLQSILTQTYTNFVVHISDNASTDDTLKIVETLIDSRVIIHRHKVNIGGEGNFTRCIELATGKYTVIFHADDIYESNMLAKQVAYLEEHLDIGAVFTEAMTINEQGVPFGVIGNIPHGKGGTTRIGFQELLQTILLHHNFLVCPSVMVRTEIYTNEIKKWGSDLFRSASDVDTWLRLANIKPIVILGEQLMRYRISNAQFSHKNRIRTERADFFRVMDYYLTCPNVLEFITNEDLRHYGWLERHERVSLAINLLSLERLNETKEMLDGVLCWDALYAATNNRRGLVTLAGYFLLRLLTLFNASKWSIPIIKYVKKISWR